MPHQPGDHRADGDHDRHTPHGLANVPQFWKLDEAGQRKDQRSAEGYAADPSDKQPPDEPRLAADRPAGTMLSDQADEQRRARIQRHEIAAPRSGRAPHAGISHPQGRDQIQDLRPAGSDRAAKPAGGKRDEQRRPGQQAADRFPGITDHVFDQSLERKAITRQARPDILHGLQVGGEVERNLPKEHDGGKRGQPGGMRPGEERAPISPQGQKHHRDRDHVGRRLRALVQRGQRG